MTMTPDQLPIDPYLDDEVVRGVLFGPFREPASKLWDDLGSEDAAFARGALIKVEALRASHADPGDAYLAAVADLRAVQRKFLSTQVTLDEIPAFPPITQQAPDTD